LQWNLNVGSDTCHRYVTLVECIASSRAEDGAQTGLIEDRRWFWYLPMTLLFS